MSGDRWDLLWPRSARSGLGLRVGQAVILGDKPGQVEDVDEFRNAVYVTIERYGLCRFVARTALP